MSYDGISNLVARPPAAILLIDSRFPYPNEAADLALITNSPFESIAGIESDVPVPGPDIYPPAADCRIAGKKSFAPPLLPLYVFPSYVKY